MKKLALSSALALGLMASLAVAADRASEDDMFGGGAAAAPTPVTSPIAHDQADNGRGNRRGGPRPAPTVSPAATDGTDSATAVAASSDTDTDAALTNADPQRDAFANGSNKEDPLQIGGDFYQQYNAVSHHGDNLGDTSLTMPLQVDLFLDGRPNDRVRTYVAGRLMYDPSKDAYGNDTSGKKVVYIPTVNSVTYTVTPLPINPQVVLDQAWVKFDIDRAAFVSLGKQHVKWGTGHIWNPTDALNPQHLDPLQPYDLRLGANLLTVQIPWEAKQSNLYAIAVLDNPTPASDLQQNGGAFRAETVLFGAEMGIDAVARANRNPVYGADLSTGLGPVDFTCEAAVITGDYLPTYQYLGAPAPGSSINSVYAVNPLDGHALQVSTGLSYEFGYAPNRSATLGGEYFYNELGTSDAHLYPILLYLNKYQALYNGKHYGAIYLSAEGLDSAKDTSYNLSTICNLTDNTAVTRFDFTWLMLDYLTFGANVSVDYGSEGGEFNFSLDTPALTAPSGAVIPAVQVATTPVSGGVSLRMGF